MSSQPFYLKEAYPVNDFQFRTRKGVCNFASPLLIRHFSKVPVLPNSFDLTNSLIPYNGKLSQTEGEEEILFIKQNKLSELIKIRPLSVSQLSNSNYFHRKTEKRTPLKNGIQKNKEKFPEKPEIIETDITDKECISPHNLKAHGKEFSKSDFNTLAQFTNIPKEGPLQISPESPKGLLQRIRSQEKMNLHNVDYLKSFFLAYNHNLKESVTMGVSSNSVKNISKHLKPELYLKLLKNKSLFHMKHNTEKKLIARKFLKSSVNQRRSAEKSNEFFVVLSSVPKEKQEKVPIIHGWDRYSQNQMQENSELNLNKNRIFSSKAMNIYRTNAFNENKKKINLKNTQKQNYL